MISGLPYIMSGLKTDVNISVTIFYNSQKLLVIYIYYVCTVLIPIFEDVILIRTILTVWVFTIAGKRQNYSEQKPVAGASNKQVTITVIQTPVVKHYKLSKLFIKIDSCAHFVSLL